VEMADVWIFMFSLIDGMSLLFLTVYFVYFLVVAVSSLKPNISRRPNTAA